MAAKLLIEDVRKTCLEHGFIFRDNEYIHSKYYHNVECTKCNTVQKKKINTIKNRFGCSYCYGNNKKTYEEVKSIFSKKDFELLDEFYKNSMYLHNIKCKKCGLSQKKKLNDIQNGRGCPRCYGNELKTTEQFIEDANKIHGFKYNYELVNYINAMSKVKIICSKHGMFEQIVSSHLSGCGCNDCGYEKVIESLKFSKEEFIQKAIKIHKDKFSYEMVNYVNNKIKILIFCKKCNVYFNQAPDKHLSGQGHKKCSCSNISKPEIDWLNKQNIQENYRQATIIVNNKNYLVDAYIPETNTIYEFFGDFWHGNPKVFKLENINPVTKESFEQLYNETMNRLKLFEDNGYNVIYIWENDYNKQLKGLKNNNTNPELKAA